MTVPTLTERVRDRLAAGALVVVVQEADEALAITEVVPVLEALRGEPLTPADILPASDPATSDAIGALALPDAAGRVLVVLDYCACFNNPFGARIVRNVATQARADGERPSRLVLIERPETRIPEGMIGDSEVITSTLPDVASLRAELDGFLDDNPARAPEGNGDARNACAAAVAGLPRHEASRLFARCAVEHGRLEATWLRTEKARRVSTRLGGALTFEKTDGPDIGGADILRAFVTGRGKALGRTKPAAFAKLPEPKGIFLAGTPGSGKSEFARYAARLLGLPLMRLDVGRVMAGHVGESELNMRQAQEAIVACAPVVVLLDECDKAFGGATGPSGDSGTTQRVFGSFLTFLQENVAPVFLVATANRAWTIPGEFFRSGRFDAVFYVGQPTEAERRDILAIHLDRFGWPMPDADVAALAAAATEFSGAELRQAVVEAGFAAFADGARKVTAADVMDAIGTIVPVARTAAADVAEMAKWAEGRARSASSKPATKATSPAGRPGLRRPVVSGGAR